MRTFKTVESAEGPPIVHVAGRYPAAVCPACRVPSTTTNGTGWRDVIDVVRTLVITLSICVRRFVCENEHCSQISFDERFDGIDRRGASARALAFFADLARGRATAAVARDLGVPLHYLRVAVGEKRRRAHHSPPRRLGRHLAIDECSVARGFLFATVFSDPQRGVVIDVGPGREAAVVWAFASQYSHRERARVQVVTMDLHDSYRSAVRVMFPHAVIVADSFHLHRLVLTALAEVRRAVWSHLRRSQLGHVDIARDVPIRRVRPIGRDLKRVRFALARARDDLLADTTDHGQRQRQALEAVLGAHPDLTAAYQLKEAFRAAMGIAAGGDVNLAAAAFDLFDALCRGSGLKQFTKLAGTFTKWRTEIVAYAATGGASNAFAEAINHLIKNQKRQAHGYPTWQGFRGQILWTFGEAVDPTTGEIRPLRQIPRGKGATWHQPQFA